MIVTIDWNSFQIKYLKVSTVFVEENEMNWTLYTTDGKFVVKTVYDKSEEDAQNIMFVEKFLTHNDSVVKVLGIVDERRLVVSLNEL